MSTLLETKASRGGVRSTLLFQVFERVKLDNLTGLDRLEGRGELSMRKATNTNKQMENHKKNEAKQ